MLDHQYIVGLTGGIGSGKTTIANRFIEKGIDVIDADDVAREVVFPGTVSLKAITQHFGNQYLNADGTLNRSMLREKVFSDDNAKQWLNNLLHPAIRESMLNQLSSAKSEYCILVAPLLIENDLTQFVDTVLVIDVKQETQIARTKMRDGSNEEIIKSIIASQVDRKTRLEKANFIIDNQDASLAEVEQQVNTLHTEFIKLAQMKNSR